MSTFSEGNLQYPRNVSYNFRRYEDTTPVRVEAEGKRYVGQLLNHEPPYRVRVTEEIVTPGSARFIPVREIQLQSLDGVEYLHQGHHAH
ncbi:hypothetical protein [Thioalkalivibrio sp. ALgr3]|uniref:hypothetical protein n=1 Tax=Thioalkalivibrio sp. ALgr3 TaxID=1239292 RepID=UPI00035EDC39|nr:hypothetical protein [Thioalkalivibrio sp. ALgr3]